MAKIFAYLFTAMDCDVTADSLLAYIEACVDEMLRVFPSTSVVLAGDLNQLDDCSVVERTGFVQLVQQPTRGQSMLDRIFVSGPMYDSVRVVTPILRSDHKAVVAYAEHAQLTGKASTKKLYRQVTPAQHALFLQHISTLDYDISHHSSNDTQSLSDCFYKTALQLLNSFSPERTITVTTRESRLYDSRDQGQAAPEEPTHARWTNGRSRSARRAYRLVYRQSQQNALESH